MSTSASKTTSPSLRGNWRILWGLGFLAIAILVDGCHFAIFHDGEYLFKFIGAQLGFLPISVFLVTVVLNSLMARRERQTRLNKMNMVIGTFFSETGNPLLKLCRQMDQNAELMARELAITANWRPGDYQRALERARRHHCTLRPEATTLTALANLLAGNRQFLLGLLRNPTLLEHNSFSELLWAVFHLAEELQYREDVTTLPRSDLEHLQGDIHRAYRLLLEEWLAYMAHLQQEYPYLFSLAMRTNPFDPNASVTFTDSGAP